MDNYKQMFNSPSKVESLLMNQLSELPAFQQFFANNSALGGLFRLPNSGPIDEASIAGMQTRSMIMAQMGERLPSNVNAQQMMNNSIQNAQSTMRELKNKINSMQSNGDADMPDFTPNNEKTKSFLKRVELGINVQSVKSNVFFPSTTDIGLSIGYRFTGKAIAGVGASYKLGLGKDFRHIQLSHQGMGFRSFVDVKLNKLFFWLTGGVEMNYKSGFKDIESLKDINRWQHSGLLGLSKKYQINKKKGEIRLLYDIFWNRQIPAATPIIFRTGYTF